MQKLTLLDYPGRIACAVFLGGCDFRCPWCHNYGLADGSAKPVMAQEELLAFLQKRRGLLDGVAVTGGEPLLHDLTPLLTEIKALGYAVKLDTNGAHPERLRKLLAAELVDYVAMDVKNSPARYGKTIGQDNPPLTKIRESIESLLNGNTDYEFRTTVVREFHTAESFHGIGQMIRGAKRYFLQCFTDQDSVPHRGLTSPSKAELETYAEIVRAYVPEVEIRGVDG